MGIRNIDELIRTEENSVTFDKHKFIPYPNRYESCLRCGRPKDHQVHIQEEEEKNEDPS